VRERERERDVGFRKTRYRQRSDVQFIVGDVTGPFICAP
jgi:hypothetical protein